MEAKSFNVYKGLQKPLIFKGLRGKFIYYGAGCVIIALIICSVLSVTLGFMWGGLSLLAIMFGGLSLVLHLQKKGLHSKDKRKGCFIVSKLYSRY